MMTFPTSLLIAATTLVAAGAAAAETSLKTEIPFTFRANCSVMPAEAYRITFSSTEGEVPLAAI